MAVTNVDQGELKSKEKAAGPTPSRYVMDEVGKYAFKPIYLAAKPSLETSKGFRSPPILLGTGGEVELSLDAQDVANNPEKFSLIAMNWDMIDDRCSEPTWKPRKWVVFVPTQMEYDGPDLQAIGVVREERFNSVLMKVNKAISILKQSNSDIYNESYTYSPSITLEHVPYSIVLVAKGGFILPKDAYRIAAGKLILNSEYGFEADDVIMVLYRGFLDI